MLFSSVSVLVTVQLCVDNNCVVLACWLIPFDFNQVGTHGAVTGWAGSRGSYSCHEFVSGISSKQSRGVLELCPQVRTYPGKVNPGSWYSTRIYILWHSFSLAPGILSIFLDIGILKVHGFYHVTKVILHLTRGGYSIILFAGIYPCFYYTFYVTTYMEVDLYLVLFLNKRFWKKTSLILGMIICVCLERL